MMSFYYTAVKCIGSAFSFVLYSPVLYLVNSSYPKYLNIYFFLKHKVWLFTLRSLNQLKLRAMWSRKCIYKYSSTYLLNGSSFTPLILNFNYLAGQIPWLILFQNCLGLWLVIWPKYIVSFSFPAESKSLSGVHDTYSTVLSLSPLQKFYSIGNGLSSGLCCISYQWDLCRIMLEYRI